MKNLNAQIMKTVVETFIIEETQALIYDNDQLDKWNSLVSSLGLKGQTKICAPEKSPIPFLPMKRTMAKVFETLCARKVGIAEYDKTPIPVEILDLVALSHREKYFNKVEIWYDDVDPDPVCIGFLGDWKVYDHTWKMIGTFRTQEEAESLKKSEPSAYSCQFHESQKYLIGRWADVKMKFSDLVTKAKTLYRAGRKSAIEKEIVDAKRRLEDLDHDCGRDFGFDDEGRQTDDLPF